MSTYATQPAQTQYGPPRRSFAGPIVLIGIGVVLLLGNLHVLPWFQLRHYFARYWPLLIIFWGLVKLAEYFLAKSENRRYSRIGAGSFVLIGLLSIVGFSVAGMERVNWTAVHDSFDVEDGWWNSAWGSQTFNYSQELQQDFPAGSSLRVTSDRGSVTVTTWTENRIKVTVAKHVRANDEQEGARLDEATRPQITSAGTLVMLNANTSAAGARWVESNLEIFLPRAAAVEIATRNGDVTVRARDGNVQVNDARATVSLEDVKGNATVNVRRGSARLAKITGDVIIEGEVEEANIADVGGSVVLNGGVTDTLSLSHIAKGLRYQSNRTTMELAKLDGNLTLSGGDLSGSQIVGPLRLITRSKEIHFEGVSGDVRVENSNGMVEIEASKLPVGSMQLTNRRGGVRVVLPAKSAFQLDAHTRRGDISSEFTGINVQSQHRESRATGSVGNGAAHLQIETDGGDVEIKKAG